MAPKSAILVFHDDVFLGWYFKEAAGQWHAYNAANQALGKFKTRAASLRWVRMPVQEEIPITAGVHKAPEGHFDPRRYE